MGSSHDAVFRREIQDPLRHWSLRRSSSSTRVLKVQKPRNSDLAPRRKDFPKRRHRSEVSCEDNIDDNADPGDSDYVHDSGDDPREISAIPHRTKRVRRAAAPRAAIFSQHNSVPNSANEAELLDMPADQIPLSSLRDIETIPVRGFLTRQILLSKVVYSFTAEEQLEHTCLRESGGIPSDSRNQVGSRLTKPHHPGISRPGTTDRPTRFLPEEDQLLIELKEDRGLPWKQILKTKCLRTWREWRSVRCAVEIAYDNYQR